MAPRTGPVHTIRRGLRSRLLPGVLRLVQWILGRLSWSAAQRVGRGLGRLGWWASKRDRERSLRHLALAFPDTSPEERRRMARACLRHQGMNLTECLHLLGRDPQEVENHVDVEGWDRVEALRRAGRPILLLTAHVGNWELLGPVVHARGVQLWAVVRALDEEDLHEMLARLRRHFGSETIERGAPGAARRLLKALRGRDGDRALLMLIDQDTQVEGVWVPFFGRPAFTPVGAARIALRQDAAVVPAFVERRDDGSHVARFHPPLDLPDDETRATARMTRVIEERIRRRPEQWVWMHRRWRRQPEEPTGC